MEKRLFAEQLAAMMTSFLRNNPDYIHAPHLHQYLNVDHSMSVFEQYEKLLLITQNSSVIDVGSGAGYVKVLDKRVHTANLPDWAAVERFLNVEGDIVCTDCTLNSNWIRTDNQYDYVILHRFMPWAGQEADPAIMLNVFTEVCRILKPDGKLLYTPISTKGLRTTGWKHINTGMHTFEITKQQLYDAIHTANKILQT